MALTLDSIIAVDISLGAISVQQKGFGRGLILGGSNRFTGGVLSKIYSSAAAMLADTFTTSDVEYKAAVAYFAQTPAPSDVMVGYAPTDVAQVETITPTNQDNFSYTVTINGVVSTFTTTTGGTPTSITTGLAAAINAQVPALPVVTSGTTTLILTAATAGVAFTIGVSAHLALAHTTPDTGVDTALANIVAAGGKSWYGLILTGRGQADIQVAAAWIEAQAYDYIFMSCSQDSAVLTAVATDVASVLQAKAYLRTAYLWSDDQADFPDAAWLGEEFPKQPGSSNYAYKLLAGITPTADSVMTDSKLAILEGKNGNYYVTVGVNNITRTGKMAGGQWIDVVVGRDWIKAQIQQRIFQEMISNPKISFDDPGIGILANVIRGVLQDAENFNIITPGWSITVPRAASFTSAQRGLRILPGIPWSANLKGAINGLTVTGTLVP